MIKFNGNKNVSYIVRIFFPLILFIGGMFVVISLTLPESNKNFGNRDTMESDNKQAHFQKREASTHNSTAMAKFWDSFNPQQLDIPSAVANDAKKVKITIGRINVMNVDTFYREAVPPSGVEQSHQSLILLHGASFKSQTWLDLNTINLLAGMGHHVIAVDLPGYGETSSNFRGDNGEYLKSLISSLELRNFVIVSPSMSGSFSIPYLIQNSQQPDGYVPVAPVSTAAIVSKAPGILTPTLIIYGELDKGLGTASLQHLSNLPNSKSVVLPKASHPAYLDQPEMFHKLLYNFMIQIKKSKAV